MSLANFKASSNKGDANETLDLLGHPIQFLSALSDNDEDYCLMRSAFPAGALVPIHSHVERETFYVIEGEVQVLWDDRWITVVSGETVDVPGNLKHAVRNISGAAASLLVVTSMRLARFLREIAKPMRNVQHVAPTPAERQRFVELAHAYGYWLGGPADNKAVGISLE
jgi:quercetin dioxygenase-like cupin family protein